VSTGGGSQSGAWTRRSVQNLKAKRPDSAILQKLLDEARSSMTQAVSLRIPISDLDTAKAIAGKKALAIRPFSNKRFATVCVERDHTKSTLLSVARRSRSSPGSSGDEQTWLNAVHHVQPAAAFDLSKHWSVKEAYTFWLMRLARQRPTSPTQKFKRQAKNSRRAQLRIPFMTYPVSKVVTFGSLRLANLNSSRPMQQKDWKLSTARLNSASDRQPSAVQFADL